MSTRNLLIGLALVGGALLGLHFLGNDEAQAICELSRSASTCAYALR